MLAQRLTFGSLLIVALVAIFWGDIYIAAQSVVTEPGYLSHGSIIPLAVVLLTFGGTLEALSLVRSAGYQPMGAVVLIAVLTLNVGAWLIPAVFPGSSVQPLEWALIVLMLSGMAVGVAQVVRHRTERGIGDISVSIMLVLYMGTLPSMITALRAALEGPTGGWAVVLFIAVVKGADIGAYFSGLSLGRTKLIPSISPGKTVEGLAGGLLLAIVLSVVLVAVLPWRRPVDVAPMGLAQAVLFGALVAGVGQVGDLVESVFKRDALSKDSGRLIPAFGGILDLLDSPAFAAPVGYVLLRAWLGGSTG